MANVNDRPKPQATAKTEIIRETITNTTEQPSWRARWPHEPQASFTGKVMHRIDGAESAATNLGTFQRGEVKAVQKRDIANSLVENGHIAHAPADVDEGQDPKYRTPAKAKAAPPVPASQEAPAKSASEIKPLVADNVTT